VSGFSIHPVDVLSGWVEREGIFLVLGWLAALPLWWVVVRHTNPAVSWNRILIALYLLGCGFCLGHFGEAATRFFWTRNLRAGADCLISWVFVLSLAMDEFSLYVVGVFMVYALVEAVLPTERDWLSSAAMQVSVCSETEKSISRPYTVAGCLTLSVASSFVGFVEVCEKYALWLTRKGLIGFWEAGSHSVTYFLGKRWVSGRLVRRDRAMSWIRVDDAGRCAVFLCRRDLDRLGGRRYISVCEELAHIFSDTFCTYVLEGVGAAR